MAKNRINKVIYPRYMSVLNVTHVNDFTKNIYGWMRVERNKIWTMCSPKGSISWSGNEIFDYDVYWEQMYEIGDFYVLPNDGEVTIVRKDQMINTPQKIHYWKSNEFVIFEPWREVVYYSKKTKRYNIKQRLDARTKETECK